MESKILVIYVGVANIRSVDIEYYVHNIARKIIPKTFEGEIIIIPTNSVDSRVECINPKYITDSELVKEHTELMKKLNDELKYQISLINNEQDNNEKD